MRFCTNCGAQVPDGSRFCTECGTQMQAAAAAAAAPAAPAAPAQPVYEAPAPAAPAAPAQPVYEAPAPAAPAAPAQPVYEAPAPAAPAAPAQPVYEAPAPAAPAAPAQPAYQAPPQQSAYQAPPQQPAYQAAPQQPAYVPPVPPAAPGGGGGGAKPPKEKKPINKKLFMFGGIGLAVILVVVILIVALSGGGGKDDPNLGMYNCVSCTSMGLDLGEDGEWVELKAKGKADIYLFGEEYSAKWSLDGEDFVLTQGGDDYEGSLKNGVLTIDFAGMLYTYEKEGGAPASTGKDDKPADTAPEAASEAGYWTLLYTEGDDPSMVMDEETVKMMAELGMEMYVVLNEDGSGVFSMEGPTNITWGDGKISAEGESLSYAVEGDKLVLDFMGTTFYYVRGEGEAPGGAAPGVDTPEQPDEPDEPDEPVAEGPYAWWDGEWYGWWIVQSAHGYYEDWEDYYWDAYARIDVDGETGWMDLWDVDTDADDPLASMEVYFTSGVSEHGTMRAESGYFMDYEIQHADWSADPGAMGFDIDELIWIDLRYVDPTDEDDYMDIYVFLRPWGKSWDDLKGKSDSSWPYDDMMPMYYDDWYMPLIKAGKDLPDSFVEGQGMIGGGGSTSTGSGDSLGSGGWEDCVYSVVGAEAFVDDEGDDAIRIFYTFTNNSDEVRYATEYLDFEVTQDGYEAQHAFAAWDEDAPEYDNSGLYVRPGVTILCCKEFSMKASGGSVEVLFYNWWNESESFTVSFDPQNLPGRPPEYQPEPIGDPQWVIGAPSSGSENGEYSISIDSAEIVTGYDCDIIRFFFTFTNNSSETTSAFWDTSIYAFQDGVQMPISYYSDTVDTDDLYYDDVEPGDTLQFSLRYELRSDSPVEIEVQGFWGDVVAGACYTIE